MKLFLKSILLVFILQLIPEKLFAFHSLDTVEPFDVGLITDHEFYYGVNLDNGITNEAAIVLGGGLTKSFSYIFEFFMGTQIPNDDMAWATVGGLNFAFTWNILSIKDSINLDLLPVFSFEPNKTSHNGKIIKPDFRGFSLGSGFELNIIFSKIIQPYMQAGFSTKYNTNEDSAEFPLSVGIAIKSFKNVEFLAQFDLSLDYHFSSIANADKGVGIGVNAKLFENVELLTGMGIDFKGAWGLTIGYIYSL